MPEKAITIRDVEIAGKPVVADQVVWVHGRTGDFAEIEYRNARGRIRADAIVSYPVKGPGLEELRKLDPCFGLPDDAFESEHVSADHYYERLRCRAHGRPFLRDTRGTIAMYSTLTLLKDDEEGGPDDIWARYHGKSDSKLMLEGRTL
jgi:hypothetical protein